MKASKLLSQAASLIALAVSGSSCSKSPTPPEVVVAPAPAADSPRAALRLLEWCWNQRDTTRYARLLPSDFVFQFGALDPYGNAYRDRPWTRTEESISIRNLFHGSPNKPAASSINLALDHSFRVFIDPRPGMNSRWHKVIRTGLSLRVIDGDTTRFIVSGTGDFYFVRGDSASIPQTLIDVGVVPDSTCWYLERWEEGIPIGGAQAQPTKFMTVGAIKALHL